jgi:hypothetical protein
MKEFVGSVALWVLASPVALLVWLARTVRRIPFWKASYSASVPCRTCGVPISLVGQWRCSCSWEYRGSVLLKCPACGSVPRILRCLSCGCTQLLPEDQ